MNLNKESISSKLDALLENLPSSEESVSASVSDCLNTLEKPISESIEYLASDAASESMKIDPYWPKWNSPWWHMTLLYEIGLAKRIPYKALELLEKGLDDYLHFFPATEAEVPEGRDPIADVVCQCALGTAHRILLAADVPIDRKQPWIREWFSKYQLSDGGYNCDEAAYAKPNGKSSMISTIHIMESFLAHADDLTEKEIACLDRSAEYLLDRKLLRSLSKADKIIDPNWVMLTFPRFYEIDILRTFQCIIEWSLFRKKPLPFSQVEEVFDILSEKANRNLNQLSIEREYYSSITTRIRNADGSWQNKQPVTKFPLLVSLGQIDKPSPFLTKSWYHSLSGLSKLRSSGILVDHGLLSPW